MSSPSNSSLLQQRIALVLPALQAATRRLYTHPEICRLYPEYLIALHGVGRASVPLMQAALGRAQAVAASDPVAARLVPYFQRHIPEELHAHWLVEDLQALGRGSPADLERVPSVNVATLVGIQYYWVLHHHPVSLLGYMAVIEGNPPSTNHIDELISATGYPRSAFRSLTRHATIDKEHGADLEQLLDGLPLSKEQWSAVGNSAFITIKWASLLLDEIVELHASPEIQPDTKTK